MLQCIVYPIIMICLLILFRETWTPPPSFASGAFALRARRASVRPSCTGPQPGAFHKSSKVYPPKKGLSAEVINGQSGDGASLMVYVGASDASLAHIATFSVFQVETLAQNPPLLPLLVETLAQYSVIPPNIFQDWRSIGFPARSGEGAGLRRSCAARTTRTE